MSSGRSWMLFPLVIGVGVGGLWWAFSPGPQLPTEAGKAASAKAGEVDKAQAARPGQRPASGAQVNAGGPAGAGPGGGPPVTDPQQLRALAQEMRGQLDNGANLPGNPLAGNGGSVPIEDPATRFNRDASNAVRRAELAAEDARARYKWDDATWAGVNESLDRYDQKLAEIQKRHAIGAIDAGAATLEMHVAARALSDEISKQTDPQAGAEISKAVAGNNNAEPPAQEIDWWEGIPFEEWAAQMEAEQKGKK